MEDEPEVGPYTKRATEFRGRGQILDDPDLYGLLVDMYRELGESTDSKLMRDRAEALEAARSDTRTRRASLIQNIFDADKRPRREFAVRARQFLTEREAGRVAEEGRLRRGKGKRRRVASTIQASAPNTLGGNAITQAASGRAANVLGQTGVLG